MEKKLSQEIVNICLKDHQGWTNKKYLFLKAKTGTR